METRLLTILKKDLSYADFKKLSATNVVKKYNDLKSMYTERFANTF